MNYTNPNRDSDDTPEDWLYSVLAFSQALAVTIPEGQGVVVKLKGDALEINPDVKKIIVHHEGKMVSIENITEDDNLKHGDWVIMTKTENMVN